MTLSTVIKKSNISAITMSRHQLLPPRHMQKQIIKLGLSWSLQVPGAPTPLPAFWKLGKIRFLAYLYPVRLNVSRWYTFLPSKTSDNWGYRNLILSPSSNHLLNMRLRLRLLKASDFIWKKPFF